MKFIWSESSRFIAGAGGTENHTLERARELMRRGYSIEIIFLSEGRYDPGFDDVPYSFTNDLNALSSIDDTIIYIARGQDIPTARQSFVFLHFAVTTKSNELNRAFERSLRRSKLITNSIFSQHYWANRLGIPVDSIAVVYPFAHPAFAKAVSDRNENVCRVLYPNRITAEKGIYVFLEATSYLQSQTNFRFRVLSSGNQTEQGKISDALLRSLPNIEYMEAAVSREAMAEHYASSNIVVVPSRDDIWQEPFGMTSVEAQHAGCRVIASKSGGLSETDCGLLSLIEAGDAVKLKDEIQAMTALPQPTDDERRSASESFTLTQSVDAFLAIVLQA